MRQKKREYVIIEGWKVENGKANATAVNIPQPSAQGYQEILDEIEHQKEKAERRDKKRKQHLAKKRTESEVTRRFKLPAPKWKNRVCDRCGQPWPKNDRPPPSV